MVSQDSGGNNLLVCAPALDQRCWTPEGLPHKNSSKKTGEKTSVIMRRTIALAFISCICFSAPAFAQATYPSRPITIIVPYPPGGNLDVITRLISPSMSQSLGQTIVVDNKPGAGGLIGHTFTARASADGYT